jgi:hypothetical protein
MLARLALDSFLQLFGVAGDRAGSSGADWDGANNVGGAGCELSAACLQLPQMHMRPPAAALTGRLISADFVATHMATYYPY